MTRTLQPAGFSASDLTNAAIEDVFESAYDTFSMADEYDAMESDYAFAESALADVPAALAIYVNRQRFGIA